MRWRTTQAAPLRVDAEIEEAEPAGYKSLPATSWLQAFTSYKLQVTSYTLQATSYKLPATSHKLRVTRYKLQATSYELQDTRYKMQATSCTDLDEVRTLTEPPGTTTNSMSSM